MHEEGVLSVIHPSAIIESGAQIADNVTIGPFSVIGADVTIGEGTVIGPHVVINGHTSIGKNNRFYQFCSIGEANQDKKYKDEPTRTRIGDNNVFRESCTVHRGTVQDRSETSIGSDNLVMAYAHIAHDCVIGNHCILANNATLAGHVQLGDWVIIGGLVGIHQFCHVGAHAFIGMKSGLHQDVPPYVMAEGFNAAARGINSEGLKRRGFSADDILAIKRAYKVVYRQGLTVKDALPLLREIAMTNVHVKPFADFIEQSTRGIVR